jgi:hypothetical protein
MGIRSLPATCLVCWSVFAAGQASGHFYLERTNYALGEPIFVYFEEVNQGPKDEIFYSGDPYSFCSGYRFNVSSDRPQPLCGSNAGGQAINVSCGGGSLVIPPGGKYVERVLLNFAHKTDAPGDYTVQAVRGSFATDAKDTLKLQATLRFQVDQKAVTMKTLQPWVDQLRSTDPILRLEAARTLASIAPKSLEDVLLRFARDPWIRQFAPLAFHRLNTPRSMAAMRDLFEKTQPGTWEHRKAGDYLADDRCMGNL